MNRNLPIVALASLFGSFGIYCTTTLVQSGPGPVGTANAADPTGAGACCTSAPEFAKLAEGSINATGVANSDAQVNYGPDIDVSGYRQVAVLIDAKGGADCGNGTKSVQFRPADGQFWGDGTTPSAGIPIPVLAPTMHVGFEAYAPRNTCTMTARYVVLGLK